MFVLSIDSDCLAHKDTIALLSFLGDKNLPGRRKLWSLFWQATRHPFLVEIAEISGRGLFYQKQGT
jgi:hypothetical protein